MRPDVADGPQRAALVRIEAPVPVGVEEQPILEVVAGHEADIAKLAGRDQLPDVLVERIEPDVEVDGVDQPAGFGERYEDGRFGGGHRQRLLADHVTAARQDPLGLG